MKAGRDWSGWANLAINDISMGRKYIMKSSEGHNPIPVSVKPWYRQSFTIKAWGTRGYK